MANLTKQTKAVKEKDVKRGWKLIDAKGKVLGRMSSEIAKLLQGKHKINYIPYLDMGDNIVVINAKKVVLTGKKSSNKVYLRYSGYPGGLREITAKELMAKKPDEIIRLAVLGMLPKNKLRKGRIKRLFIFSDEEHPYEDKIIQK